VVPAAHFAEPIVVVAEAPRHYTTNVPAGTWPAAALPVTFWLGPPESRDVGADAAAELDVAARTWSHVACTGWRATYGGMQARGAADDGVNMVLFHDTVWPPPLDPGVVAQTVIHVDATGSYHDADVHVNGADYHFSLDGALGTLDLRSVLVHELGHALGLGHSTDPRATMYASGSGLRWRSLEKDDIDGVCALYPGTGAAGCDALPCPAGLLCVAGGCQRPHDRADVCSPCARVPGACEASGDDARCIDIDGVGGAGGRVCGRACASDTACGAGFHCKPTSAAGDLQCVSDDGCRSGAWPCAGDADCAGADATCRGGACFGPGDASDAGVPGAPAANASTAPPAPMAAGGGCASTGAPRSDLDLVLILILVLVLVLVLGPRDRVGVGVRVRVRVRVRARARARLPR
jgi:hypothetical protein